jgi:AGZA family xanthine/uracil permease-like MFS transporter
MESFFKLKENGTNVRTEVLAGLTTFFAMAYIIMVNPDILSMTGMPWGAVFLATIAASIIGTLVMGLFANVPYAQAPGMGLNAFFTFTVVFSLGFTWQEALAMVFVCGLINILITVTNVRKLIIKCIPESLQNAIGGGIGIFIAYIGIKNAGLLSFAAGVPELVPFNDPAVLLTLFGLAITVIMLVLNVRGAILIGIVITTLVGIPFNVTELGSTISLGQAFSELRTTFFAAFGNPGLISLFSDASKLPMVLMTIFAFSLTDTFDTIGTFIGTGRRAGIFSAEDMKALETSSRFKSKMDRALFADATATSIGAIFGTSNTTTYVESAAGIGVGGRTGLTSVVVAVLFALSTFFVPAISAIPSAATSPALIIVGIMMLASFKEVNWSDFVEAVPAFFAGIFMALCYSISYGIAAGFIFYTLVKIAKGQTKEIHPILAISTILFIINFIVLAVLQG